jgi:hypothetical protein
MLPRLDVMRLHLTFRSTARLASAYITVNHLLRPDFMLAAPPRQYASCPLMIFGTGIAQPTFIGAWLAAELLGLECRDWLTRPKRKD